MINQPTKTSDLTQLSPDEKRQLLAQLLQQKQPTFPLSPAQRRLWFLHQLQPESTAYSLPAIMRLTGNLDIARLTDCLDRILQRHTILRTCFIMVGEEPRQQIVTTSFQWMSNNQKAKPIEEQIEEFTHQNFDLTQAPLLRGKLIEIHDREHLLLLSVHHIAADYRSLRLLFQELIQLYQGVTLNSLSIQYSDYSVWQQQQHDHQVSQLSYWQQQLAQSPSGMPLFTDFPRPASQSYRGAVQIFELSASLSDALRQLSRRSDTTLFMTLLAAFKVLLYRYSGQCDLIVGSTIDQRHRPELQPLIGLFVNNLVFRSIIQGKESFSQFLQQIKTVSLEAYSHSDIPFEELIEHLNIDRNLSQNPLFQINFVLHSSNDNISSVKLDNLVLEPVSLSQNTTRFDLGLDLDDRKEGIAGKLEYSTDLFTESSISQFIKHFEKLLTGIIQDENIGIDRLPLLTETEIQDINLDNHNLPPECLSGTVLEQLDQIFTQFPHLNAVQDTVVSINYATLQQQSQCLTEYLIQQGVRKGDRVGLLLGRSVHLVVALVAVLKAGAAYVPLDPSYPSDRLNFIIQDVQINHLLRDDNIDNLIVEQWSNQINTTHLTQQWDEILQTSTSNLNTQSPNPKDTAYIIYTSGSTGQPKGVEILHESLFNILIDLRSRFNLTSIDRLLAVTTIAFDIATLELFLPLVSGAAVIIAPNHQDAQAIVDQLDRNEITIMQATPATWRMMLETAWAGSSNLQILSGGEALDRNLATALQSKCRNLWNLYGPTETTIWSGVYEVDEKWQGATVPIGNPIAQTAFHILDTAGFPVPTGVPGELHISGVGLAKGYWNRPELTAERFKEGLERQYATGDRVRRRQDGTLGYLGRLDFQVKLRGYRIELGEIESSIVEFPPISQAVVISVGEHDSQRLVGYYQIDSSSDNKLDLSDALVEFLRSRLPIYMIPTQWVALKRFPLTLNGKVDRRSLPLPDTTLRAVSPPATTTEIQLAKIWKMLLAIEQIDRHDSFFAIGGHSLLATRMIARIQQKFKVTLSLRQLFTEPTLCATAKDIDRQLEKPLLALSEIQPINADQPAPLSFAQRRFWLLNQLEPESAAYNIPIVLKVTGNLDIVQLRSSFISVIKRHHVLRSRFVPADQSLNLSTVHAICIDPIEQAIDFQVVSSPVEFPEQQVQSWVEQPFDLSQDLPLRVRVLNVEPNIFILSIVIHHIAADAESIQLLLREVMQFYRSNTSLPELPIQYRDFAAWQRSNLKDEHHAKQLQYWQQQLESAPKVLNLPTDRPRIANPSHDGAVKHFTIPAAIVQSLKRTAQQQEVTLFMLLLSAYGLLLSRYSGETEILIGSPITNRSRIVLEPLIGCFVNTLVMRVDTHAQPTVSEFLQRIKATAIEVFDHQDTPFEQLVETLQLDRSTTQNPLIQTLLVLQNEHTLDRTIQASDDITWEVVNRQKIKTKFDLLLTCTETREGLTASFEYRCDLFDEETIDRYSQHLQNLLFQITQNLNQLITCLSLVTETEQLQLTSWNQTSKHYSLQPIHTMVAEQALKTPHDIAIIDGDRRLTYGELDKQSSQWAQHIYSEINVNSNQKQDTTIGILLERGEAMLIAILAVLKSGAAYVPIDPNYPIDRIQFLIQDANLSGLITQEAQQLNLAKNSIPVWIWGKEDLTTESIPIEDLGSLDQLAYLIYTSGSTGKPKGVEITHRNAASFLCWAKETFEPSVIQGMLASTSLCFDLSIFELFLPLITGGSVILAENALALPTLPAANHITIINTVPSVMQALLQQADRFPNQSVIPKSVRVVNLAGEALSSSLVAQIYALPHIEHVYNLYGPSESTTYATYVRLPRPTDTAIPTIGRPIANTQTYILDPAHNPVPIGVPGELYLSGAGLARGYWGRPDLTSNSFIEIATVASRQRLYRTGDRARFRRNGEIEYLGRFDNQVKLRGFRIELGELESCLETHPEIVQAIAIVSEESQLIAYYTVHTNHEDSSLNSELQNFLIQRLPSYLIPNHLVYLAEFPLNSNGKVDRKALPAPVITTSIVDLDDPTTWSETEQQLNEIWKSLLNQSKISIQDNFFTLGGDSILAIQMVSAARQQGLHLTPRQVFQSPTISQLATLTTPELAPISQVPVVGLVPLAPIQQWFFAQDITDAHHWNQSLFFTIEAPLNPDKLSLVIGALIQHHDILRSRFVHTEDSWQQEVLDINSIEFSTPPFNVIDLSNHQDYETAIMEIGTATQASLTLENANLIQIVYFQLPREKGDRLLLIFHHLIIDGISWRILLEDLQIGYQQLLRSQPIRFPAKTTSYLHWSQALQNYQPSPESSEYWHPERWAQASKLPIDHPSGRNLAGDIAAVSIMLSAIETQDLLQAVPKIYQTQINDILLAALSLTLHSWTEESCFAIELEGHGREDIRDGIDISRTIGWFTTLFPVLIKLQDDLSPQSVIKSVKEELRKIPNQGLSYGVLKYNDPETPIVGMPGTIRFNYLGQTDQNLAQSGFSPAPEFVGASRAPTGKRDIKIEINALIIKNELRLDWNYSQQHYEKSTIDRISQHYIIHLKSLIQHCLNPDSGGYTPSDFPDMDFDQNELDDLLDSLF